MDKSITNSCILLVEDEESLALGLEFNLLQEGYQVRRAVDGRQALRMVHEQDFDLIILDIMLPYIDGFSVAERVRNISPQLPMLMLTARTAAKDRIRGLESGADDYLTKPFHLKELLLRVRGMLKRKQWYQEPPQDPSTVRLGGYVVNFRTLLAVADADEQQIRLTAREAMVLKYLVRHEGRVVSRKELLEKVWNIYSEVETRTVDAFISRLRKYFEPDPKNPVYIRSVRGVGYVFSKTDASEENEEHNR